MKKIIQTPKVSGDWFYMNEKEISVRDIYDALQDKGKLEIEIWEEAKVLEISYSEKASLDFEMLRPYFKDKEGDEYLKKNDIHALYMVSFDESDFEIVVPIMRYIAMNCGGFFIEDQIDFSQSMILR